VGNKLLLVSVTPTGAETLTEITDSQDVDHLMALCQQNQSGSVTRSFRSILERLGEQPTGRAFLEQATPDDAEADGAQSTTETSPTWEDRRVG
jgi:hypothetical protein